MRQRIVIWSVAAMTALAIVGCNSSAGSSTTAASQAPASQLLPSIEIPSGLASALPSVALPSPDAALEAKLPDQMCGSATVKSSAAAGSFIQNNAEIQAFLTSIGKTTADVSIAVGAGGTTGCSVSIIEIKGANATQTHDQFVAAATANGAAPQQKTIGGKTVLVDTATTSLGYVYFKDDLMVFFSAPDDAKAGELAATLP
jgi:hypothetical protein